MDERISSQYKKGVEFLRKNPNAFYLSIPILLALIFVVSMLIRSSQSPRIKPLVNGKKTEVATTSAYVTPPQFRNVSLIADSAIVWDVGAKKVIFEKNADKELPLASITKAMTALTASDHLDTSSIVSITETALATEGESGLYYGETFKFSELSHFMLVVSSNDAAEAIAEATEIVEPTPKSFSELMNERAKKLGLTKTRFQNASGLDLDEAGGVSGAYSSARDISKLFDYLLRDHLEIIEATAAPRITIYSEGGAMHRVDNTNILSSELPGLIGSKTGFTTLAGGNLAVAFDAGIAHPMVMVVLGSTRDGRFQDMKKLYNATMSYFEAQISKQDPITTSESQ